MRHFFAALLALSLTTSALAAEFIIGDGNTLPISNDLRFKSQLEALGLGFVRPAANAGLTGAARITFHLLAADGSTTARFTAGSLSYETGDYRDLFAQPLLLGSIDSAGDLDLLFTSIVAGAEDRSGFFDRGFAIFTADEGTGTRFTRTLYFGYDANWAAGNDLHDDLIIRGTIDYVQTVPEPATWALLVTGFGLTGAGLRRRRAIGAAA